LDVLDEADNEADDDLENELGEVGDEVEEKVNDDVDETDVEENWLDYKILSAIPSVPVSSLSLMGSSLLVFALHFFLELPHAQTGTRMIRLDRTISHYLGEK
jgi:hypothetical protein